MFELQISTANAAFNDGENGADELARILRELADRLDSESVGCSNPLRDINGNRVGAWAWTPDADSDTDD